MFCHKCGTQIDDEVVFCPKCGTKVISADAGQQANGSVPVDIKQQQPDAASLDKPNKRKPGKLPLILGVIVLVIIGIAAIAVKAGKRQLPIVADSEDDVLSEDIVLSETYTDNEAGISFNYPAGWEIVDPSSAVTVVLLIDSENDLENRAVFEVSLGVDILGVLTGDEASLREAYESYGNSGFVGLWDTSLNGVPAKCEMFTGNGITKKYWYTVGEDTYIVTCSYSASKSDIYEPIFDAIMDSYTITAATEMPASSDLVTDNNDYSVFAEALWNIITYNTLPDGKVANDLEGEISNIWDQFAICDIDQDGVEELLIKIQSGSEAGQGQYIYKVDASQSYLEKLHNFAADVVYYDTGVIKEDWAHNQGLSTNFWPYDIWQWGINGCQYVGGADAWEKMAWETDFSGNSFPDKIDEDKNGIVYFIGGENGIDYDNPVDDAEYSTFMKKYFGEGNEVYIPWQNITEENIGSATGYDMMASAGSSAGYGDSSYDATGGFSEPLEYYSKFSGFYEGSDGQMTLGVSIFTSQEEGEISIGNVRIYVDDEEYYFGEIIGEIEKDVFVIAGDTGEDVIMYAYSDYGTIAIDLYADGQYIDEYLMVEHYEP